MNTYWYFLCSPPGDLGQTVVSPPSAPSAGNPPVDINAHQRPLMTKKAKVLYDYDASDKEELSLLADEVSIWFIIVWITLCESELKLYFYNTLII